MSVRRRLVASSALMLFLELALIRWAGSNVLHLSYFSNFVLLGSFLGIGLGFLRARVDRRPPYYSPVALAALVAFITLFPVEVDRQSSQIIYFTNLPTTGLPIWVTLPLIFLAVAVVMMGPAEMVGMCFLELPRLESYRWDLVGSLIGIAGFTGLAFLHAPPLAWGLVVAAVYVVLLAPRDTIVRVVVGAAAVSLVGMLAWETFTPFMSWSPYYKVTTDEDGANTLLSVNGVPHQRITTADKRQEEEPQYSTPYERTPGNSLDDVLVVGAGSGSDVAIALQRGAGHVDAVEIDPRLHQIGEERNPDRPYSDDRVTSYIDDGRAYLERTDKKYDLILFALPDSLTLVNGASSLRLESYLFTQEAIDSAREHLKPSGAFAMYNYYREPWLRDRLATTVQNAFGHPPCVDVAPRGAQQAVITAAADESDQRCLNTWVAADGTPAPATDDRPFLYLKDRTVPSLYMVTILGILVVSLLAVRVVAGPLRRMRPYADLFLLGVGFMLLETKSVTGFALLFGTTWVVNAIVFAGVLVAVLAAVEVTRRVPTPPLPVLYAALGGGLLLAWLVPNSWLLGLPVPVRLVAAVGVAFLPIFAANVVFAKRFADTADATTAFGANLLGAMVGGCMEYVALVVGYHALLVIAGLLYVGSFVLLPRVAKVTAGASV